MKRPLTEIRRDYLALRGESPDLLPQLEEGEYGAVLTLSDELRVKLMERALEATLITPSFLQTDAIQSITPPLLVGRGKYAIARLPADYLKLHTLMMDDWREPLTTVEREGLRAELGSAAPDWMICPCRPMVREASDSEGKYLKIYGTRETGRPSELEYIPMPRIEEECLVISSAAYHKMLELLNDDS